MPKVQVYLSRKIYSRIQSIIDEKYADGASEGDCSLSSVSLQLIENGLKVHDYQQKEMNGGNGFDQGKFNQVLLESVLKNSCASSLLLQLITQLNEVKEMNMFEFENIRTEIRDKVQSQLAIFFPDDV